MDRKKLEIGEIVVIKRRMSDAHKKDFVKPLTFGKITGYNRDDNGEIYSYVVHGEDGFDYAVCYPTSKDANYIVFTRKEYISSLRKKQEVNTRVTNKLIEKNNQENEKRNNKLKQEMEEENDLLEQEAQSVCKKYGHVGPWKKDSYICGTRYNAWLEQDEAEYAPMWVQKCKICGNVEEVRLRNYCDMYDWHKSWPKSLIDYIEDLEKGKRI